VTTGVTTAKRLSLVSLLLDVIPTYMLSLVVVAVLVVVGGLPVPVIKLATHD
jgi:hypothetical protein